MADSSVAIEVHRLMYSDESEGGDDLGEDTEFIDIRDEVDNGQSESDSEPDDLEKRQLAYPPLPVYHSPTISHAKERLGLLTPTEELSEGENNNGSGRKSPRDSFSSKLHLYEESNQKETGSRRVSFTPERETGRTTSEIRDENFPDDEIEDLIRLQSRQELVLSWQEKHLHYTSSEEFKEILDSSEMDSSTIMKSLRSIPPSNFATMVQEMTNSLTTLRSQLSTLTTISLFGDRLRELQPYEYNLDLLPLLKKLCTLIGESRSPESALTLGKLIQGAGPSLVADDLIFIINSNNMKRKPAAIDGLTYGLLTFPRDDFDLEKIAEGVCRCLWNPKRRIRQSAIECLAVVAHVLGPGIAMPFLREVIEQNRPLATTGNPSSAVSARVSRRLLPSPSPNGLIDYGLVLPSKQLSKMYLEQVETGLTLDPILSKTEFGADILWILHGAGYSDLSTDRSSSDRSRRKSSNTGSVTGITQATGYSKQHEVLHQKRRDSLVYEKDELAHGKLSEYQLQELERNYERSLADVDDFHLNDDYVGAKTSISRDRDSGVSSLKSVRVVSPTESISSKSPVPDNDVPVFPQRSTPSISSQSDPDVGNNSPFVIRKPIMARSSRTSVASLPTQTGRSGSVTPIPMAVPGTFTTTASSASSIEHSDWLKKSCPTKIPPRKAKSRDTVTGRLVPSKSSSSSHLLPATSRSNDSPKNNLSQALGQLGSTEWEITVDGFGILSRLLRHHQDYIKSELPTINRTAILHLSNLRTQVTRAACLFFEDLFVNLGKSMEQDCEKIAEKLLDKTADTNKFIRDASMAALEAMVKHVTPAKAITPLENYGSKHRNTVVRATTAHVTRVLVEQLGPERVLHQNPNKLLPMLIKFLQEGSLETRTHAKLALASLVVHGSFESTLKRHIPPSTLKNVEKTISSIKNDLIRKG